MDSIWRVYCINFGDTDSVIRNLLKYQNIQRIKLFNWCFHWRGNNNIIIICVLFIKLMNNKQFNKIVIMFGCHDKLFRFYRTKKILTLSLRYKWTIFIKKISWNISSTLDITNKLQLDFKQVSIDFKKVPNIFNYFFNIFHVCFIIKLTVFFNHI